MGWSGSEDQSLQKARMACCCSLDHQRVWPNESAEHGGQVLVAADEPVSRRQASDGVVHDAMSSSRGQIELCRRSMATGVSGVLL